MGLIDDLKAASASVDPQFQPSSQELPGFVAALALYAEHGDTFTQAATDGGTVGVTELINPDTKPPEGQQGAGVGAGAGAPAADPSGLSDEQLRARISDLQAQLDTRTATAQQTQVEHRPGEKDDDDKPASSSSKPPAPGGKR